MTAQKQQVRTIGILYLFIIALAGFSQGAVREVLIDPINSTNTLNQIQENIGLFRIGMVTDLIAFLLDAIVSVLLYFLFRNVDPVLALISSALRLIAHPAIASLNLLNHYGALKLASGSSQIYGQEVLAELVQGLMDAHNTGYLIAGVFFGAHLVLLGVLICRSSFIPKIFAYLCVIAGIAYLAESMGDMLVPGYEGILALFVGVSAALAELGLAVYLTARKSV